MQSMRARAAAAGTVAALLIVGATATAAAAPPPCVERSCVSPNRFFRIGYAPRPDPIPFNRPFQLNIEVSPADDETAGCVPELAIAATMPEHRHGMTLEPRVERTTEGRFRVRGMLFHMPGRWWIEASARCGAWRDRVVFEVVLE